MTTKPISVRSPGAPDAIGPYVQAVKAGGFGSREVFGFNSKTDGPL